MYDACLELGIREALDLNAPDGQAGVIGPKPHNHVIMAPRQKGRFFARTRRFSTHLSWGRANPMNLLLAKRRVSYPNSQLTQTDSIPGLLRTLAG